MKKKLILLVFCAIALCVSGASNSPYAMYEATIECKYDQCHAIAKSTGKRCKHCVSNEGDKYCWQHRKD